MQDLSAHFEGCLLGAMLGDSLGSVLENATPGVVEHRHPDAASLLAMAPGSYGSTTEMTLALAESLVAHPEFEGDDFARRLLAHWTASRGYGQGTTLALHRLKAGVAWQEAGAGQSGRGCYGNAAAARSAAVGLLHRNDVPTLRWVAEEAAGVTHTHAHGVEGAALFALAVAVALDARGGELAPQGFLETIAGETQMREYRSHLELAASMLGRGAKPVVVADRLGNNQTALGSVVTALFCFADHAASFEDAALAALRLGGNAVAIVAMTLALSGAHLGITAIPQRWREGLEKGPITPSAMLRTARALAAVRR